MVKTAECPGMRSRLGMRCEPMLAAGESSFASAVKSAGVIEIVTIDEDSAVGDVRVVVENDSVVVPVGSPVFPAPAKSSKEANPKAKTKCNSRAANVEAWVRIPARPDPDGPALNQPGVILRHVNNLRIGWFDHDGLPLLAHLFLRGTL